MEEHAAMVMEVVPVVMDTIRSAMRLGAGANLSVPQFRCLNFIARTPACAVGEVAAFLGVTMPTASAMVDRLVRAELVLPATASDDRRRSQLQATPAGLAQLEQIQLGAQGHLEDILSACSPTELQTLQAGLAVLSRTFQSNPHSKTPTGLRSDAVPS
ncbi:MarR family winged helix-turn-helix transcriptional regulator [Variovorax sp. HJSM1_2]|uniref:MarR family winged helix-turn-helix transcriptional regulator n=1 Tax=Variovorax sp. HJSM1_2 TaxID=3366263 RepID=UPI003BCF2CB4